MKAPAFVRFGFVLPMIGAAAVLVAASPVFAEDAAVELKPVLKTGKKYVIEQDQKVSSTMTVGDNTVDTTMNITQTMSMAVNPVEGSENRRIAMSVDTVKAKMNMLGQEMVYDSSDPSGGNPLIGTAFSQMIGKPLEITLDPSDSVVEVKGFDALQSGAGGNPLQGALLSDEVVKQIVEALGGKRGFPGKPVKPGDTWKEDLTMPVPQIGELAVAADYKYEGREASPDGGKELEKITFAGTLKMASDTPVTGPGGVGIKVGDSTMSGTVYFDTEEEFVRHSLTNVEMNMQIDNGAETVDVPSKQTITVRLKSIESVE